MANHQNRGKLNRDALELVAKFAAGGIALSYEQQQAIRKICFAGLRIKRLAEEECNGDWPIRKIDQDAWRAELEKQQGRYSRMACQHAMTLAPYVAGVKIAGDPRGATVKLVMQLEYSRLHDDWGREGICVPGS